MIPAETKFIIINTQNIFWIECYCSKSEILKKLKVQTFCNSHGFENTIKVYVTKTTGFRIIENKTKQLFILSNAHIFLTIFQKSFGLGNFETLFSLT